MEKNYARRFFKDWSILLFLCVTAVITLQYFYDGKRRFAAPHTKSWVTLSDLCPKSTGTPYKKKFAYHTITEECIPPYLLQNHTLGDGTLLDVYVLSFRSECKQTGMPDHVVHVHNTTFTWTTGRNFQYEYVKSRGYKYMYQIFFDDDLEMFFSSTYEKYANKVNMKRMTPGLPMKFLKSEDYKPALNELINGKSAFRRFEDILLEYSPAYSVINHLIDYGFDARVEQERLWPETCRDNGPMPLVTPSFFVDAVVMAYHEDALPLLMPYSTVGDKISWFLSAVYFIHRVKAILYKQGITAWEISHVNFKSRPYPRTPFPPNYLDLYHATKEGAEVEELTDVRDRNFVIFYKDNGRWRDYFFRDRGVCTKPLKFPVHKHYRLEKEMFMHE